MHKKSRDCYFCKHCNINKGWAKTYTLDCNKKERRIKNFTYQYQTKPSEFKNILNEYYSHNSFPKLSYFERYCDGKYFTKGSPIYMGKLLNPSINRDNFLKKEKKPKRKFYLVKL